MIDPVFSWDVFLWFAVSAVAFSAAGAIFAFCSKDRMAIALSSLAIFIISLFIAGFWTTLDRPPLKTMGETRLWYSVFLLIAGLFTYVRWRYRWILSFSTILSAVFLAINLFRPEIHDQTLMPVLRSPWFIPHVILYMFSYSLLGCAFLVALAGLFTERKHILSTADTLVWSGLAFFTFGMLTGAIWAKSAWGSYWSWDPKETWALITWLFYVLYIHLRKMGRISRRRLCLLLVISFASLQMCWWGISYLPSAQDSVHVYSR